MGEVKGGIVIEQLKRYAKRLSDYTGDSVSIELDIWYHRHRYTAGNSFDVRMSIWDSSENKRIAPRYTTEDLRDIGKAIDDYINGNSKKGK